ncbi:hypothetical protein [Nitratireductor sp. ZSWI3]|uniref:hypothetical protein n=1 Tax=Nitratireductor sp. ZSWI3 TaxID=2966359 RepID=UPI00214FB86C|nr:hypothetical protein [Nitratireductor sp. ZSWI3]MCR4264671.1 hypothetical protein [Nitratireductor sp. ZSWI3]
MVEWLTGIASGCLLLALVGYLLFLAVFENGEAPTLVLAPESVTQTAGRFHMRFTLTNQGDSAAAEVRVKARSPEEPSPAGEVVFDYVPAGSTRRGTLVFAGDPAVLRIALEVVSYREP